MKKFVKRIIEEEGWTNIKNIRFDEKSEMWVVSYKDGDSDNEFSFFSELVKFYKTESGDW